MQQIPRLQTWFQYLIKEDYNILNYNGVEYTDYNSTLPTKAQLYSNNSLVFARNLYNKTEKQQYNGIDSNYTKFIFKRFDDKQ